MKQDDKAVKRHWHLVVFEVPAVGHFTKISSYLWSRKRMITVPEINNMRIERNLPANSVLVNIAYMGMGTQYELTGSSPDPVPTRTTPAYLEGLSHAVRCEDPALVLNPHPEEDLFHHQEWQTGFAAGLVVRANASTAINE